MRECQFFKEVNAFRSEVILKLCMHSKCQCICNLPLISVSVCLALSFFLSLSLFPSLTLSSSRCVPSPSLAFFLFLYFTLSFNSPILDIYLSLNLSLFTYPFHSIQLPHLYFLQHNILSVKTYDIQAIRQLLSQQRPLYKYIKQSQSSQHALDKTPENQ